MDVQLAKTPTLRLVPDVPMSAPTAQVIGSNGAVIASAVATPSTVDTTVIDDASVNKPQLFRVASTAGIARGLTLRVYDLQWGEADGIVSGLVGDFVRLVEPLPATPTEDSVVKSLDVFVALPAAATSTLGLSRRIELSEGNERADLVFNVLAYPLAGPCRARHVRKVLAARQGSVRLDEEREQQVSDVANEDIRGRLMASHLFVSAYWDPAALRRLRRPAIEIALGEELGVWPANIEREAYVAEREAKLEKIVAELIQSAEAYDRDRNGALEAAEAEGVRPTVYSR